MNKFNAKTNYVHNENCSCNISDIFMLYKDSENATLLLMTTHIFHYSIRRKDILAIFIEYIAEKCDSRETSWKSAELLRTFLDSMNHISFRMRLEFYTTWRGDTIMVLFKSSY